MARICFSG